MSDQDSDYIEHSAEGASQSNGNGLALPNQQLPKTLHLLPINNRPFFPAQVMPVVVNEQPWHETIEQVAGTEHKALSLFYVDSPLDADGEIDPQQLPNTGCAVRIRHAVRVRLKADTNHREAARRAAGWLSLPGRQALGGRLIYATADHIWHWAGDKATDYNYYTKRGLLSGILVSALPVWLNDHDDGLQKTRDFVDRRIENVMQFGKIIGRIKK